MKINNNQKVSADQFIEKTKAEVYPITLVKFLLNKKRIMGYFSKAANPQFKPKLKFDIDFENCKACQERKDMGILCREHTSTERILRANSVLYDLDTNTYLYKNEIFKMIGSRLVVAYCPHPKLISGEITDSKVRRINPMTVEDENLTGIPQYENVGQFLSTELLEQNVVCWFNNEFSIVTIPADRNGQNWCLIPNR